MTEIAEPPPALPAYPAVPEKTTAQVAAILMTISGAAIFASAFAPAYILNDYRTTHSALLSDIPDGPVYTIAGLFIAAFGLGRYHADHPAFRIFTLIGGVVVGLSVAGDAMTLGANADTALAGTGVTFTYGPALCVAGVAAAGAIVSSIIADRPPRLEPVETPARAGDSWTTKSVVTIFSVLAVIAIAAGVGAAATQGKPEPVNYPVGHVQRGSITTGGSVQISTTLVIPNSAVILQGGNHWVNVPGPNGEPTRQQFTPGLVGDDNTQVLGGLSEGQEILLPQASR